MKSAELLLDYSSIAAATSLPKRYVIGRIVFILPEESYVYQTSQQTTLFVFFSLPETYIEDIE